MGEMSSEQPKLTAKDSAVTESNRFQHRITVRNFGPLEEITDFPIRDLVCIIGEQSVGKSTLAKLIYFCRDIRNEFISLLQDNAEFGFEDATAFHQTLQRRLKSKFFNIYGLTDRYSPFRIVYHYSDDHALTIEKTESAGTLELQFSPKMLRLMEAVIIGEDEDADDLPSLAVPQIGRHLSERQHDDYQSLSQRVSQDIFFDDYQLIYVPAGRGLMSRRLFVRQLAQSTRRSATFGERETFDIVDSLTRIYFDYIETIRDSWERFQNALTLADAEECHKVFALRATLHHILKGEYKYARGEEFITTKNGSDIPIAFASSGQQEVLWISNILQYLAFTDEKCFIVIEEPEAHLFSKAQSELVHALAMFVNITGSQLFLTTHSPYIVISLSNLLFAGTLDSEETKEAVEKIIPEIQHLKVEQTAGMLISDGRLTDILDASIASLDVAKLDYISEHLADVFEDLLLAGKSGKEI